MSRVAAAGDAEYRNKMQRAFVEGETFEDIIDNFIEQARSGALSPTEDLFIIDKLMNGHAPSIHEQL